MLRMVSYPHRLQSGHITCYLNRTYHVLPTKFGERLDAWVPWLLIDFLPELFAPEPGMLLQPSVRFHDLIGISGSCENLRDQGIGIKCDGSNELLQLLRRLFRRLHRSLRRRLNALIGDTGAINIRAQRC